MRRWSAKSWIEDHVTDLMSVYADTRQQALEFLGETLAAGQYEELSQPRAAQVGRLLWGLLGPRPARKGGQ